MNLLFSTHHLAVQTYSMMLSALIAILLLLTMPSLGADADWSYSGANGPEHWVNNYPMCGRPNQSPIDIAENETKAMILGEITFANCTEQDFINGGYSASITNIGHTILVRNDGANCVISGGGLPGNFKVDHFHLHWGSDSSRGSEHTLNGQAMSAELHFASRNTDPNSENRAAVFAVFIQAGPRDNPAYDAFLDYVNETGYKGDTVDLGQPVPLMPLLPDDLSTYYRYNGSKTSPDCIAPFIWTVFKDIVQLSETQLEKLRALNMTSPGESPVQPMVDNFRTPQPITSRTVYRSDAAGVSSASANRVGVGLVISCLVAMVNAMI